MTFEADIPSANGIVTENEYGNEFGTGNGIDENEYGNEIEIENENEIVTENGNEFRNEPREEFQDNIHSIFEKFEDVDSQAKTDQHHKNKLVTRSFAQWLQCPINIDNSLQTAISSTTTTFKIHPKIIDNLKSRLDISQWFGIQTAIFTHFKLELSESSSPTQLPYYNKHKSHDLCINAPTGSGKTLTYLVPIVQNLWNRKLCRLRALIIVPTRELAAQVRHVAELVAAGSGLRIGLSNGFKPLHVEQNLILRIRANDENEVATSADMLICTPGRIVDHILHTPNFSLKDLEYLVVDEADRLVSQQYQNWLNVLNTAISLPPKNKSLNHIYDLAPKRPRKILVSATLTRNPEVLAALNLRDPKLFVVVGNSNSTNNLEDDNLDNLDDVIKFQLPPTLKETNLHICDERKPLYLAALIVEKNIDKALVFLNDANRTFQLARMMQSIFDTLFNTTFDTLSSTFNTLSSTSELRNNTTFNTLSSTSELRNNTTEEPRNNKKSKSFHPEKEENFPEKDKEALECIAFTADISRETRKQLLNKFRASNRAILVCTDLMARGVDLVSTDHVINYDIPLTHRSYIHRVGRTARAGRHGNAWNIVSQQEGRRLARMMQAMAHAHPIDKLSLEDIGALETIYDKVISLA